MFTTSETYPWSLVAQLFHDGQPSHGGDRKTFEVKMLLTNSIHVQLQADVRKFKLINVR